jgi:hypothetical protein
VRAQGGARSGRSRRVRGRVAGARAPRGGAGGHGLPAPPGRARARARQQPRRGGRAPHPRTPATGDALLCLILLFISYIDGYVEGLKGHFGINDFLLYLSFLSSS